MKKRTLKYACLVISLVFLGVNKTFSQSCPTESNTYYLLTFLTNLKDQNNRPATVTCILQSLDSLTVSKLTLDELMCSVYKKAVYVVPPPLGYERKLIECCNPDESSLGKTIVNYQKSIVNLDKKSFSHNFKTNDNSSINITIQKFSGSVWTLEATEKSINNISHQLPVPMNCYGSKKYFMIKGIQSSFKLTEREKLLVEKLF